MKRFLLAFSAVVGILIASLPFETIFAAACLAIGSIVVTGLVTSMLCDKRDASIERIIYNEALNISAEWNELAEEEARRSRIALRAIMNSQTLSEAKVLASRAIREIA